MKIYCALPITGRTFAEVMNYYTEVKAKLSGHYHVLYPMARKEGLKKGMGDNDTFQSSGYEHAIATNHAIVERDRWMVTESNVVFINLLGAKRVSIGCCMEMAWAHMLGKHTVLVMEEGNIHHHAFVLECADIVLPDYEEAIDYLIGLAEK